MNMFKNLLHIGLNSGSTRVRKFVSPHQIGHICNAKFRKLFPL